MAFRKFTRSEKTEVLSPEQHKAADDALKRLGAKSAKDLSSEGREQLQDAIDNNR